MLLGLALTLLGAGGCFALARTGGAAVLGGCAGWWLSVALSLTVLRGGYVWSPVGLHRCVITQPIVLSPDGLTNLLLFAPAALLAVLAVGRAALVVIGLTLLSCLVEVAQAYSSVGVCDSSDVVLNALGSAVSALVAAIMRSAARPRHASVSGSDLCPGSS